MNIYKALAIIVVYKRQGNLQQVCGSKKKGENCIRDSHWKGSIGQDVEDEERQGLGDVAMGFLALRSRVLQEAEEGKLFTGYRPDWEASLRRMQSEEALSTLL